MLLQEFFLETVQKVGKIVDIHFFENVAFETNLPVKKIVFSISAHFSGSSGYKLSNQSGFALVFDGDWNSTSLISLFGFNVFIVQQHFQFQNELESSLK